MLNNIGLSVYIESLVLSKLKSVSGGKQASEMYKS